MSKGSARRPCAVSRQQFYENYDAIFGKKEKKESKSKKQNEKKAEESK